MLDLAFCEIIEHAPGYNRLILKIVPTTTTAASSILQAPGIITSLSSSPVDRFRRIDAAAVDTHVDDDDGIVDNNISTDIHTNNDVQQLAPVSSANRRNSSRSDDGGGSDNSQNSSGGDGDGSSSRAWSLSGASSNATASSTAVGASGDREKVLFIGFEESWERDLWSAWLIEVIAV